MLPRSEADAYLRMHDEPRTTEVFSEVTRRFPTSYAAPEADFFHALAVSKATHQPDELRGPQGWGRVRTRYPMSVWRIKQLGSE